MSDLSHVDEGSGDVRMVDVGDKPRHAAPGRCARDGARWRPRPPARLRDLPKGDALAVAQIAGIQAASAPPS